MKIRLYVLDEPIGPSPVKHLAHLDLGGNIFMSFFGATSAEALKKADTWYRNEKARQEKLEAGCDKNAPDKTPVNPGAGGGRGVHFAGKVWMMNNTNGEKLRVPEADVTAHLASGFIKAGPRTVWRGK